MSDATALSFTIVNNDSTGLRVDYRQDGKVYDSHVPNEDAMQATFDSQTIPAGASHSFSGVQVIRIVKLGA